VRDAVTLAHLRDAGLAARLVPDAAVLVEALFGTAIRTRMTQAPLAAVRAAFPGGCVAVQLSTEFGDDATLAALAAQLEAVAADTGLGIVLLRAGAAPWHDDAALLERLAARLPGRHVRLFSSLHVWDLCALLAHARAFAGSSLHGCIVANAFGVPAVGLEATSPAQGTKLAAVAATWHAFDTAVVRDPDVLAAHVRQAIEGNADARRERAAHRVEAGREAWRALLA
jgi:polysaccharide pyruvyl transferase WcaK-like protein